MAGVMQSRKSFLRLFFKKEGPPLRHCAPGKISRLTLFASTVLTLPACLKILPIRSRYTWSSMLGRPAGSIRASSAEMTAVLARAPARRSAALAWAALSNESRVWSACWRARAASVRAMARPCSARWVASRTASKLDLADGGSNAVTSARVTSTPNPGARARQCTELRVHCGNEILCGSVGGALRTHGEEIIQLAGRGDHDAGAQENAAQRRGHMIARYVIGGCVGNAPVDGCIEQDDAAVAGQIQSRIGRQIAGTGRIVDNPGMRAEGAATFRTS